MPDPTLTAHGQPVYRARDLATGAHVTIAAEQYDPTQYRLLQSPAVDGNGIPVPPKPNITKQPAPAGEADEATSTTEATKEAN